jgi:S1-C subfamily serine protease
MDGKVIGIHSRIAGPLTANIHVPVDSYRETWDRLTQGESWGGGLFGTDNQPYLGVEADPESEGCKIGKVYPDSPAAKAGLRVNDVVLRFAGKAVGDFDDLRTQVLRTRPGQRVRVEVQRGDETLNLDVTIGKRPD